MAIKDILVHLDNSKIAASRLDVAAGLAARHDAHLTGLHVDVVPQVPGFIQSQLPREAVEQQSARRKELAEKARAAFDAVAKAAGIESRAEWRSVEGRVAEMVNLHGRYADLVVLSQADPEEGDDEAIDLPGDVVLAAGRPVLVVPYVGAPKEVGRRVVIAWNGSREATRAVNDALPVLERAEQVSLLVVDPRRGSVAGGEAGTGIAAHLSRHGVKVEVDRISSGDTQVGVEVYTDVRRDMAVGDVVLARLADEGADLLVMGAYGRSRTRELVLGGATRHILRQMTVPVFMSH